MEFKCREENCTSNACWECDCGGNLGFCEDHIIKHCKIKRCSSKYAIEKFIKRKFRLHENALNQLSQDIIKLSKLLIKEIHNSTVKALQKLKNKKNEMKTYLLKELKEPDENLTRWTSDLRLLEQDQSLFYYCLKNLFNIEPEKYTQEFEEEKFADKDHEPNSDSIRELEKKISLYKNSYKEAKIKCVEYEKEIKQLIMDMNIIQENIDSFEERKKMIRDSIFPCKLKLDTFNDLTLDEKIACLVDNDFKCAKEHFVGGQSIKIHFIKKTNDENYVFVCNLYTDCKGKVGIVI